MENLTREIASKIVILSETSTVQKSWSNLAERLFIIATKDWFEKSVSTLEIEKYLDKAKELTDETIANLFRTR